MRQGQKLPRHCGDDHAGVRVHWLSTFRTMVRCCIRIEIPETRLASLLSCWLSEDKAIGYYTYATHTARPKDKIAKPRDPLPLSSVSIYLHPHMHHECNKESAASRIASLWPFLVHSLERHSKLWCRPERDKSVRSSPPVSSLCNEVGVYYGTRILGISLNSSQSAYENIAK